MNDADDDKLFAIVLALLASGKLPTLTVVAHAKDILDQFNKAIK